MSEQQMQRIREKHAGEMANFDQSETELRNKMVKFISIRAIRVPFFLGNPRLGHFVKFVPKLMYECNGDSKLVKNPPKWSKINKFRPEMPQN